MHESPTGRRFVVATARRRDQLRLGLAHRAIAHTWKRGALSLLRSFSLAFSYAHATANPLREGAGGLGGAGGERGLWRNAHMAAQETQKKIAVLKSVLIALGIE